MPAKLLVQNNSPENKEILVDFIRGKKYMGDSKIAIQKAPTQIDSCMFYAMKRIMPRYGKKYNDLKRKYELAFSEFRKNATRYSGKISIIKCLINAFKDGKEFLKDLPKEKFCMLFIQTIKEGYSFSNEAIEVTEDIINEFKKCLTEKSTLSFETWIKKYMETALKASIAFSQEILKKLNFDDSNSKLSQLLSLDPENLEAQEKTYFQFIYVQVAQVLDLTYSKFSPQITFDELLEEIKNHGPVLIPGFLGKEMHSTKAKLSKITAGPYPLNFFDKGTFKPSYEAHEQHGIIVVGGKREAGKEYLFYLDANDNDDPHKLPTLYMTSFNLVKSNHTNVYAWFNQSNRGAMDGPFAWRSADYEKLQENGNTYNMLHLKI